MLVQRLNVVTKGSVEDALTGEREKLGGYQKITYHMIFDIMNGFYSKGK